MRLFSYGASHALGYNQQDWNNGVSHSSYPCVMARTLDCELINRAKVGSGADYVYKTILAESEPIREDDIAVVQINGASYYRTVIDTKTKKIFRGVLEYHPFQDEQRIDIDYAFVDYIDFMVNVTSIYNEVSRRFSKYVIFLDDEIQNYLDNRKKARKYTTVEQTIIYNFEIINGQIYDERFLNFGFKFPNGGCLNDPWHFEAEVHQKWAEALIGHLGV